MRTVNVTRAIDIGDTDYFTFPTTVGDTSLISASRDGAFGVHGSGFRNSGSITLSAVPEPTSLVICGLGVLGYALRRRRI